MRLRSRAGRREQAHGGGSVRGPPSDTAPGLAERSSAGGSLEARFTTGCARRRPERSPGDGGSIPPTSTFSAIRTRAREERLEDLRELRLSNLSDLHEDSVEDRVVEPTAHGRPGR